MNLIFYWTLLAIWITIIVIAVVVELNTFQFFGIGGAIAAFVALGVHLGKVNYWAEFVSFAIVWVLSWSIIFLILYFNQKKRKDNEKDEYLTKFIDKEVLVYESKGKHEGRFMIKDVSYKCISEEEIAIGDSVIIKSFTGVTFNVIKKEEGK